MERIPRTIMNCTPTLKIRPPERLQRAFQAERVWEIDTGHDLMITEPEEADRDAFEARVTPKALDDALAPSKVSGPRYGAAMMSMVDR